ncbi:MAG: redoxin domain-containing protein [Planctomycetota bacterium]|nr:redoxin domain-containing protein [Planctomycetota bacterium]
MTTRTTKMLFAACAAAAFAMATPAIAQDSKPEAQPAATQPSKPAKDKHGEGHKDGEKAHKDKKDGEKKDADKKDEKKNASEAVVGSLAPDFILKDTDGKDVKLSDLTAAGNIVVIQWFNPGCPFVVKHYEKAKTFNDMAKAWEGKKVVMVGINSGAPGKEGAGKDASVAAKKKWNMNYAVLLDEDGKVGKAYGAKNTPAMYVVAADGKLAYAGAIDDDSSMNGIGKTNYVTKAVDELLAGKPVSVPSTKPYGCSVKYATK